MAAQKTMTTKEGMEKALNHIASAHAIIDEVQNSLQKHSPKETGIQRDASRVANSLDIAGTLTQLLYERMRAKS